MIGLLLVCCVWLLHTSTSGAVEDQIPASLRFPRHAHLREDDWKDFAGYEPKLKRWNKQNGTLEHDPVNMEEWTVPVASAKGRKDLNILTSHFELVDLHPRLLPLLRRIKQEGLSFSRSGPTTGGNWFLFLGGGLDETLEDKLARSLQGSDSFSLGPDAGEGGGVFHYAFRCTGFVIRKGGPEGAKVEGAGFDNVAQRVHIDQDLQGEPLKGMGLGWVFRLPYIRLLNVWSPLHDVRLRPMAFADFRTVQRGRDVVRYRTNSTANAGGRFGSFASDRLMSLYSQEHEWFWYPDMRFGQAVAFDTADVPHSSFTLPGEEILAEIRNDIEALRKKTSPEEEICARRVDVRSRKDLSLDMEAFIGAAEQFKRRVCERRVVDEKQMDAILEYISRASLEIRCVTLVAPKDVMTRLFATLGAGLFGLTWLLYRRCTRRAPRVSH